MSRKPIAIDGERARVGSSMGPEYSLHPACGLFPLRFPGMAWVSEVLGASAIIEPGASHKDHLRAAIQTLSGYVPQRRVYSALGWRKIDDEWHYLHASGAINAGGIDDSVEVSAGPGLESFDLPVPPEGEQLADAVGAVLELLEAASTTISYPLLAATVRAVLMESDVVVWVTGQTGVYKTAYAALFQQFHGAAMDDRAPPATWEGTANFLEGLAYTVGQAVLLIDDFAPDGTAFDAKARQPKAARVLRAQGNRRGRGRMMADTRLRAPRPPRCVVISTGEDIPAGHSIRARTVIVDVGPNDVDREMLAVCQSNAATGLHADAMAAYIQYLAGDLDRYRDEHRAAVRMLRATYAATHQRTATAFADLDAALERFLLWAASIDALTEDQVQAHMDAARAAFRALMGRMAELPKAEDPIEQFYARLASAISSGVAHVAGADGNEPRTRPQAWGWREDGNDMASYRPQGARVGWLEGSTLYIDLQAALKAVERGSAAITVTDRTLAKTLAERGHLVAQVKGKHYTRKVLGGVKRTVFAVLASRVLGERPEERAEEGADLEF